MEKMKLETANVAVNNVERIGELFPNCITESKDEKGNLKRAINFELLRQMLSEDVVEGKEAYEFTWVGKKASIVEANKPIRKTLRPCKEESVNWDTTENLYIEGDNLQVLKLLQESYLGKVKMIYIDPPYNTGSDFIYNDDFKMKRDDYAEESGEYDDVGNRMFKNEETAGRYHSDWCSMIYSRLLLARNLLSDDGVIFISIDDHEQENLKKICDEVFGQENFIGMLVLKTATDNNPSQINIEHEYMLCYAKSINMQVNWLRQSESAKLIVEKYSELKDSSLSIEDIEKELRNWIKKNKSQLSQVVHYNCVDEKGVYSNSSNSSNPHPGEYMFDVFHPKTGLPVSKPKNGWRWPEETFLAYLNNGEVDWGKGESTQPHIKKRIETAVEYLRSMIYEDNRSTTKMLFDLFDGVKIFDNPKPLLVLQKIVDYTTSKDSIILDFFSGSATTAHAVMKLNMEDNGNRKFIMVQLPEDLDKRLETSSGKGKKSIQTQIKALQSLGRSHTICEIGKERIRRAGQKILSENEGKEGIENLDIGFRVLKLDDTNMKDVYYAPQAYTQDLIAKLEENVKEDRTDLDLLFGCLLEWGLPLSLPYSSEVVDGCTIHNYNDGDLMACFDAKVPDAVIRHIAKLQPLRAVFRDSSFVDSPSKINVGELFKSLAPDTRIKVI